MKKEESKRMLNELKIWEKKTATCRNQLKHYKNFTGTMDDKHITKTAYKNEDKKLI